LDDLDQLKESGAEKVGNQSLIGLAKQTASLQDQLAGLKLEEYLGSEPVKDLQVNLFQKHLFLHQLEVWFYMNDPSKLAAPISRKQFFGLQSCF
jgi:hypothetical protein